MALSEAERQEVRLIALGDMQAWVDREIQRLNGRDRRLVRGEAGREREVICESLIGALRELKESCVVDAAKLRAHAPLLE